MHFVPSLKHIAARFLYHQEAIQDPATARLIFVVLAALDAELRRVSLIY